MSGHGGQKKMREGRVGGKVMKAQGADTRRKRVMRKEESDDMKSVKRRACTELVFPFSTTPSVVFQPLPSSKAHLLFTTMLQLWLSVGDFFYKGRSRVDLVFRKTNKQMAQALGCLIAFSFHAKCLGVTLLYGNVQNSLRDVCQDHVTR